VSQAAVALDPRMKARRIAVLRAQGRRRLHILVALAAVALVAGLGFGISQTPLMDVDRISVRGGGARAAEVLESTGFSTGMPMLSLDLGAAERAEIVSAARRAVLDFFTAFNAGDVDGSVATLNHPHLFMTPGGGFSVAESPADGPRPDFDRMRRVEDWHMSTIDALEPSIVTRNKVHFELTFTRWHPDGTRYWTVPALWIVTRAGDHWGIQVRSLMPATFDARGR